MRTKKRVVHIGVVLTMLVGLFSILGAPANATSTKDGCAVIAPGAKAPRPNAAVIGGYVSSMHARGASQATIDSGLNACYGLTPATPIGPAPVQPNDASQNDIAMPGPSVYWSSTYNDNVVTGTWNWNSFADMSDGHHSDGFALGASNNIRIADQWAGWNNPRYSGSGGFTTTAIGGGSAGRGFGFDNYRSPVPDGTTPTAANGYATIVFDRYGMGCSSVYFNPKYSHGWSGTSLTSFSIGISGATPVITANYTTGVSQEWQGYGHDSQTYNIC